MVSPARSDLAVPMVRRVSWGAIFAALFVVLALELVLNLLGIGFGAGAIHVTSPDGASASGLGIGSGIWFFVSTMISLFVGGWVAGRLAGMPRAADGALHGIVAWSLATLATVYLLTTAVGGLLGGATGLLGSALGVAGKGIGAAAPAVSSAVGSQLQKNGVNLDSVTGKIQQVLKQTGDAKLQPSALRAQAHHQAALAQHTAKASALNPQQAGQNYNDLVFRFLHDTGTQSKAKDRQDLINVVAAQTHVSKAQATQTVDGWQSQADAAQKQAQAALATAQADAKKAADAAAAAVSKAAFGGFVLLVLGAIFAALGGIVASKMLFKEDTAVAVAPTRIATIH